MINKQSLWFVTLLTLVLVLGVYYITMPNSLLKSEGESNIVNNKVEVSEEKDMFQYLKAEKKEKTINVMKELQDVISDENTSSEKKNNAFEELKLLNLNIGKEGEIENKILDEFKIKSYCEIDNDQIKIIINSKNHDASIANKIMRSVQKEFKDKKFITVKFGIK